MRERSSFRLLDAALSGDTAARKAVAQSPALRAELAALEHMRSLLQESSAGQTAHPFLAERVVRRIRSGAHREQILYGSLLRVFRPVVVAALLLIVSLAAYNITFRSTYTATPTTTEVMLGLQPVTLTEAFAADLETVFPANP